MKQRIQSFLRRFSFRTGIIILALCVPCYIISFAQMALPIGYQSSSLFSLFECHFKSLEQKLLQQATKKE